MESTSLADRARKRVLCVFGYDGYLGAERANTRVLRYFVEGGAEVHCLVHTQAKPELLGALASAGIHTHTVRFGPSYFGLGQSLRHYVANLAGIVRVSLKLLSLFDKIRPTHLYVPNYLQFLYAWPALVLSRSPIIFRVGDPPETNKLHRLLWHTLIQPFVRIFTPNSEFTKSRLMQAGVPAEKIEVFRNSLTRAVGSRLDSPSIPTVVYLGQINLHKGVDIAADAAIEMCARHATLRFVFVGPLDQDVPYVSKILDRVRASGYADRIEFTGYRADVHQYLTNATVHICPSVQQESSANVVVEAKFAGIPSVVFPNGGLPELVSHRWDGYVCARPDRESLIAGIEYFLERSHEMPRIRSAVRQSAEHFTPVVLSQKWIALLERVASKDNETR